MATAVPRFGELAAPAHWRTVDFISDLHLQAAEAATFEAWRRYMDATPADAVFILGDLFEVWAGDDAAQAPGFEADCADVMHRAAQRLDLFFMHGNRDFLVSAGFMAASGATLLADPTVLDFAGARWLLTHGDMLCLDDTEYMAFRAQVRTAEWQRAFLARPLAERQALAQDLRRQSQARKRSGAVYADVDGPAACEWLGAARAGTLIHGHTHRPADHALGTPGSGLRRVVLSDWEADAAPPRAQALRLAAGDAGGPRRVQVL
jgi:UDP-2,3-diacylglucosamine hydrolase